MASKDQFETFKAVYKDEQERYAELINRGKIFLTIISLYLGVLTLNLKDTSDTTSIPSEKVSILYALAIIALAVYYM